MKIKKILVIDDEDDFKILMTNFFSSCGCEVFIAGSIKEGLQILDQEHPDIMFLDNNLPDGLGWEYIDFIIKNYPQMKLNLISAYNVPKTSSSSYQILEKPLLMDELNKFIES